MNKIPIAKIGKSYGIKGWQKIHLLTDFPEQFKSGKTFPSDKIDLTIEKIDLKRGLVKFKGIDTPEDAKKLTNRMLYTTKEQTKEDIKLKENEYFWFDIIGCEVYEEGELLGRVKEIERANEADYLVINTNPELIEKKYPKRFLIDFKRHVKDVDVENKKIEANGAKEILDSLL
ncbi:ribosome maturation factor RimM [Nautilia lithotrophica]